MTVRIRMPGGTLKIKTYQELRSPERAHQVAMFKFGKLYFVWWATKKQPARGASGHEKNL